MDNYKTLAKQTLKEKLNTRIQEIREEIKELNITCEINKIRITFLANRRYSVEKLKEYKNDLKLKTDECNNKLRDEIDDCNKKIYQLEKEVKELIEAIEFLENIQ